MMPSNVERVLLQGGSVSITTARFVVGATSYPLRGITSVTAIQLPKKHSWAKVLFVGGALMLAFCMSANSGRDTFAQVFTALLCAGPFVALGVFAVRKEKTTYVVQITTASGQVDAVQYNDLAVTQQIVGTLNQALAGV
jgi:hypothetical protein